MPGQNDNATTFQGGGEFGRAHWREREQRVSRREGHLLVLPTLWEGGVTKARKGGERERSPRREAGLEGGGRAGEAPAPTWGADQKPMPGVVAISLLTRRCVT